MRTDCVRDALGVCHHTGTHLAWAHNPSAWIGIVLCVVLLLLWRDRNAVTLRRRKRDWDDD